MKSTHFFYTFCLVTIMLISPSCHQKLSIGIPVENLDTTTLAQNDFYQYACGGWMANNPIPSEYSRFGSFDKLGLSNLEQLNDLITTLGQTEYPQGSVEQKIGDLYRLCMDMDKRNEWGTQPVQPTLQTIESITCREELSAALGKAMEYGLWGMYVDADSKNSTMNILNECQAGLTLGEKSYYLDQDEHTVSIRKAFEEYIAQMFTAFGYSDAAEHAQTILRIETRIAQASKSNVELRDPIANYNKMTVDQLQALVPQVDWTTYFNEMHIVPESLSVGQIEHLQEMGRILEDEDLEDLKLLFTWQVIDGSASYLSDSIYNICFNFYGKVLSGKEQPSPLWKRAVSTVNGTLGDAVGQMYVKKYFPEENKQRMLALVKNLQLALQERILSLTWMSDTTKAQAVEKLNAMNIKIGYPNQWRDYTALTIDASESFYTNIQYAAKFAMDYSLSFLNKPVDREKWYMYPQTVNAYYNPSTNEICFPAGILQYPFFDMSADDAFNYGAIGVVIGHEMTHGFDDQGSQFDKDGNLNNWWTEEDRARFEERTKVLLDYFNAIEVAPGVNANGALTLGENIADHGGLQIAYQAFCNNEAAKPANQRLTEQEGFTPAQRFFLAYSHVWAGNIRAEEILQRTKNDPHSLGKWRVNGALPHINAWYEAWQIDSSSPMYIAPEERASIW